MNDEAKTIKVNVKGSTKAKDRRKGLSTGSTASLAINEEHTAFEIAVYFLLPPLDLMPPAPVILLVCIRCPM